MWVRRASGHGCGLFVGGAKEWNSTEAEANLRYDYAGPNGKRKSSRVPKGNVYLKTALVESAHAAARAKGTYLRDKFYRVKARRWYKRAAVSIAH